MPATIGAAPLVPFHSTSRPSAEHADEVLARRRDADRDALRATRRSSPCPAVDAGDREHAGDRRRRADLASCRCRGCRPPTTTTTSFSKA